MNAQEPDDCAARFLQPRRPPRADSGRCPLLHSIPPHQFGVERRLGRGPRASEPPTANTYVRLSKKGCIL